MNATGDAQECKTESGMMVTPRQPLSCLRVSLGSGGSVARGVLFPIRIS